MASIVKDSRGYLWISTFNGAVRFDGAEFRNFNTGNISQLETSAVRSILPLPDGAMYFSTESSGLLYYNKGVFFSPFKDSELPRNILTTFKTPNGKLWVGTANSGLFYIENGTVHKYIIDGVEDIAITAFTIDVNDNLWVASSDIGIIKINDNGYELFTEKDGLVSNNAYSLKFYDDKLYVGTLQGVSVFKNGEWAEDKRFSEFGIYKIIGDKNKNIWFGTTLGLARLDKFNNFEFIGINDGLPALTINGIEIGEDNSIWLATYRGGLVQLKNSSFKNITEKDGLNYNSINSISTDKKNRLFIGNNRGRVDIIDKDGIQPLPIKIDLSTSRIKDVLIEDDGIIWLATYMGLIRKTPFDEKIFTKDDGLLSNRVRCIIETSDGSIWAGTRDGGISIITKQGMVKTISKNNGLSSDFIFSLDEYSDDAIIAGTSSGGLNIIKNNLSVEVINPNGIFSGVSIFNVYVENKNAMWLATNVGLYYYDNFQFFLINPSNGLAAETIFDVIEDENDNLWMTSIKGVINVKKSEALKLITGKIDYINSSVLDDSDGMITRECTGATKSLLAEDGRIWIPTTAGVAIFNPLKTSSVNTNKPSVFIENVVIDDIPVDKYFDGNLDKKVEVASGHRSYVFKFTALSMSSPQKVEFRYKLEGFDNDWVQSGAERYAKYTNLPYGKYTFKVIAINNNGSLSDNAAMIDLVIIPYFYETTTFYVILVLSLIILINVFYKFRTKAVNNRNKELIKLNAELDSFAYSVSHDLKAPLASIQGLLNVARLDENNNASVYYDRIEKSINKLDSFIKDIIDFSKNSRLELKMEEINIKELVEEVKEGVSYLNEKKKVKCLDEISANLTVISDKSRLMFIANNLITNAIRYADLTKKDPYVKITAKIENGNFVFSVIDNGQGIEKQYHKKIFDMFYRANEHSTGSGLGLYIVKESVMKLGGEIKIQSELKVGTTITFIMPL
ncbi:MAG: ATP-binding protein [Cyclobacteriaceae bacterium]|nr:ATP-binding protein [Cyclobacteriaceae bacterium]